MNGARLRRLGMILLAFGVAAACHRGPTEVPKPHEAHVPRSLRSIASAATSKARHWRSDAILVKLELHIEEAQSEKIFDFYSPDDATGYSVAIGTGPERDAVLSSARWGTLPIAPDFPALSVAEATARTRGMKGALHSAALTAIKLCGLATVMRWQLVPADAAHADLKSYDVYFYADPASGEPPMDWHEAEQLADASIQGDNGAWTSLMQAAQAGDPNAATNVGYVYSIGAPMAAKSYARAGPYFCLAAFEGSPAAQFDLALMYEHGWGVGAPSIETSGILYRQAAAQGLPEALAHSESRRLPSSSQSATFIKARAWNPAGKGAVAATASDYPDRFPPDRWPID